MKNYSEEKKEFVNFEKTTLMKIGFRENLNLFKKMLFESNSRRPKNKLPEVKANLDLFMEKSDNLKFIWFGHSTLLLNIDNTIVLVDPIFSMNASPFNFLVKRFQKSIFTLNELPNINVILISHNHYDHLDKKSVAFFKDKNTNFMVPMGLKTTLIKWGIEEWKITELNWYESAKINSTIFTAAPARHFSGRGLFDRNKTLWASWIIEKRNKERVFFSGDSGYGKHFKEIGLKFGEFDIAFIENGQYNEKWRDIHMMPEETVQAAIDLNARHFVPIHWGMFDLSLHKWSDPIKNSYKIAKEKNISIIPPKLGKIIEEKNKADYSTWWE